MKEYKIIYLLFLTLIFSCSSNQNEEKNDLVLPNFPEFSTVVKTFFEEYTIDDLDKTEIMRFEKRPSGWYVVIVDYNQDRKKIKEDLFWDAEAAKFQAVDFHSVAYRGEGDKYINKYLKDWNNRNFDIQPYFGYVGWESDVINLLESQDNLSDTLLNALASAYSAHAMNLLNNNSGWANTETMYDLSINGNAMSKSQVDEYRKFEHLATVTLKKLEQQSPDFPVFVGSVNTKWSNEYMKTFLNFRIYQNEEEARKELRDDLYSPALLGWAKNILGSCSESAILFTNGDNDTYPLLYVQAKENYRTDVLVINLSLLNTIPYISSLTRQIPSFESLPLELGLSFEELLYDEVGYVFVGSKQLIPPIELETAIANLYHITNLRNGVYTLPSPNVKISEGDNVIEVAISDNYLMRGDLVMFDIIGKNRMKRPIYFTDRWSFEEAHGFGPYLELHGMVQALMPETINKSGISTNDEIQFEKLLRGYDFSGLKNIVGEEERILQDYNLKFSRMISEFNRGNKGKLLELVEKRKEVFPQNPKYYDESTLAIIMVLHDEKEFELMEEMKTNLINNLDNLWNLNTRQKLSKEKKDQILKNLSRFNSE